MEHGGAAQDIIADIEQPPALYVAIRAESEAKRSIAEMAIDLLTAVS